MADDIEDKYAFIIDNCQYPSSQEDFLLLSLFAREVETVENIGEPVVCGDLGDLGFGGKRNESLESKKVRVLEHCSGKVVIESEVEASEVVFEGDVRVKVVRPLRCVALDGGEFSGEKLGFEEEDKSKKEAEFEGVEVEEDEEDEENVGRRNEENGETEVIDVGDEEIEEVVNLDTEVIDVDEERGMNEEMVNVDTEVVGDDVEEEDFEVGVFEFDTSVIECEEEGGIDERTSKDKEIGDVDTKVDGSCVKVDGETSNVGMEKIVVEEKEGNGDVDGKLGVDEDVLREEGSGISEEGTKGRKRKLPRSMFEQWGEGLGNGEGCVKDARMKVVGVDEKEGDCAMVYGETGDVNMEEIVVEEKEENRDENSKCEFDKEGVLREEGSRMSEEKKKRKKRKLHHSMFEQRGEGLRNGEGCSKDARMKVVGVDDEQGNYAKVDEEMSDVSLEEIVVKEKEEHRDENGNCENDKEDVLVEEKSRLNKEEMTGRTRKLPCSKDARQEGNGNGNGNGKSDEGLALIKSILDSLKFLVGEKSNDEEVDLFETAKRRGMKFPSPRFRP